MKELITAWMLSLMTQFASPEKLTAQPQFPGWKESAEEMTERYQSIAQDLHSVIYDPKFKPLFGGKLGRQRTATLVLAVAFHESRFAKDVDLGPCYRGKNGKWNRCDGGMAACMMQIKIGKGKTWEGWTQKELFADRKKCFISGIELMRRSFKQCQKKPLELRLAAYASGDCERGHKGSKELWQLYERFWNAKKVPDISKSSVAQK